MDTHFKLLFVVSLSIIAVSNSESKPNIVLVVTDDQDLILGGLTPMVKTQSLIANQGVTLTNAFVTTPVCCPSRSSLLTGKYLHNHGTVNNSVSGGCNSAAWQQHHEPWTFATHLKASGYTTFYAGKYLNQYGEGKGVAHVPPGWDWWLGLVGNSRYYNYTISVNGTAKHLANDYLTDVISTYGLEFLRGKQAQGDSFLMVLAPPAPHAPFIPAPKYQNYFKDIKAFKGPNFNVPVGKDKHWLLRMKPSPLPPAFMPVLDKVYRQRWETLLSVDDLVDSLIGQLDRIGLLNNTFIMITSDHGYHIGQFGLPWDKRQPYESDIRVPFLIRGPGVPKKKLLTMPVLNIDIAPTLLHIAGVPAPSSMDGRSFLHSVLQPGRVNNIERVFLVEYRGEESPNTVAEKCGYRAEDKLAECSPDALCKCQDSKNNTYSCVRALGSSEDVLYCQFQDSESFVEIYDLKTDPYQLHNIALNNMTRRTLYESAQARLGGCSGVSCRELKFEEISR